MITKAQAKFFVEYAGYFDDGEDPEVVRYEVKRGVNGWYVAAYRWSVAEQRRVYAGTAVDEDAIIEIWQKR